MKKIFTLLLVFIPPLAFAQDNIYLATVLHRTGISGYSLVMMFFIGITLLLGVLIFKDDFCSKSVRGNTVQPSNLISMSKYKRWVIRIIGFLFVWIMYAIWVRIDKDAGTPIVLLRSAFVGLSLLWITKISNYYTEDKETKSQSHELYSVFIIWDKIVSIPNILFAFLYIVFIGKFSEEHRDYPLHLIMAGALGSCIIPFLSGLYYNLSRSESNTPKYIYLVTTVIMYWMFLGSTAQELKEKGVDTEDYTVTSYMLIFCSIAYILYVWINKKADKKTKSQSHNRKSSNERYPDEKYYSIALKERLFPISWGSYYL